MAPSQESVWDYPRPPRVDPSDREVVVEFGGQEIARTRRAIRLLETSHPPAWYIPPGDVHQDALQPAAGTSWCEFKGAAGYVDVVAGGKTARQAAWFYASPSPGYEAIAGCYCFYPGRVDRCTVDGETVIAQEGDFYGGWITSDVAGPFKGAPGTAGW